MNESPERVNYNAFAEDNRDTDYNNNNNKNIKLDQNKSRFSKSPEQKPSQEQFNRDVHEYKKKDLDIKSKISDLSSKYKMIIVDKTVTENKSPIQKDLELSVISELANFGLELDNNENQPEGIGSIGLCNLLLHVNLSQRDIINNLSYKVSVLHNEIEKLKKEKNG